MVRLPQHGESQLYDIVNFLDDVDAFFSTDTWRINVRECLGPRAIEVESCATEARTLSDSGLRLFYRGIYQTIDGSFVGLLAGVPQFELLVFDSSFWEVSGSPDFESHMVKKYGAYQAARA